MTPPRVSPPIEAPEAVAASARAWAAPLLAVCGNSLRALYLHGSALAPEFDPQRSDVNLLWIVEALPFDRLEAMARALAAAPAGGAKGLRYSPLVLPEFQVRNSADVFPIEFLDLLERRALLAGEDVLADLQVSRANLRHQCEFELRSKLVALRQAFLLSGGAGGTAHQLLVRAGGGGTTVFRHLLTLTARPHPARAADLPAAVAEAYGIDAGGLAAPFAARGGPAPDEPTARARLASYLTALETLIRAVDALDPA